MDFMTNGEVRRPRVGAALLNSVSRTALAALTMGLALGVVLPSEARADCFFNGASSVTYNLSCSSTTFGSAANINPPGPSANGVYGNSSMPWNVSNNGSITGVAQGSGYYGAISLASSGSSVTNTGTIHGVGQHSVGIGLSGAGTVNNNAGTISADFIGIFIGGSGTVNNSAQVGGTGGSYGIILNQGGTVNNYSGATIVATGTHSSGVSLQNGGTVNNYSNATITGTNAVSLNGGASLNNWGLIVTNNPTATYSGAVGASGGGTVTNYGTISEIGPGNDAGVGLSNGSSLVNSGTISVAAGPNPGVFLSSNAGNVTNLQGGVISGGNIGINAQSATMVTNAGTIASAEAGVELFAGTVNNQRNGTISGAYFGVWIWGGPGSVANSGNINASGPNGFGVVLTSGGSVTNSGNISASGPNGFGVVLALGGTVNNSGSIYGLGTRGFGVLLESGGAVNNYFGAKIGAEYIGVNILGSAGTITNAGTIQTYGAHSAVKFNTSGSLYNAGTGKIIGGGDGVSFTGYGTVNNLGEIASGKDAVYLGAGGIVTNTGSISGGLHGILVKGAAATANNSGDIIGGEDGVFLDAGGTVTNTGSISGGSHGVLVEGAMGTVNNSGDISQTGSTDEAVLLGAGGVVNNYFGAKISSQVIGVNIQGGPGTVTNAGTIAGGTASVEFAGAGANTLTLQTGSTLTGDAIGSTAAGATNALILQGQGTANNNFVNFNTLSVQASGTWTLGGASTFGDAMVSTGALSVTGTLNSTTLEIDGGAAFNDTGAVTVTGAVSNAGALTINGVTMNVVSAGGTFTQTGGTTTLLSGGVLDPTAVEINGGLFGGSGEVVGAVSVTGGEIKPGAEAGGSLKVEGPYSQTGGEIVFDIDPNGLGGFLETTLVFDPSFAIGISDTTFVFDFNGVNASLFVADGLLNLNTFLGLTDGGQFCTELDCATVLQDISFADNAGLNITGYDPTSGAISTAAVPEPGTWALLATGFLGLGGLGLRQRMHRGAVG